MFSHDHATFDALETVRVRLAGAIDYVEVPGALRRAARTSEVEPSDGVALQADVAWRLPAAALGGEPLPGTRIVDAANVEWVVLAAERVTLGAGWRCAARRFAIVDRLDRRVDVLRGVYVRGADGESQLSWKSHRTALPAAIQPQQGERLVRRDQLATHATHRIHVAAPLELDGPLRVIDGQRVFDVVGHERSDRIDAPTVLIAEER